MKKFLLVFALLSSITSYSQKDKPDLVKQIRDHYIQEEKEKEDSARKLTAIGDYYALMNNEMSLQYYDEALAVYNKLPWTYFKKARAEFEFDKLQESIQSYSKFITLTQGIKNKRSLILPNETVYNYSLINSIPTYRKLEMKDTVDLITRMFNKNYRYRYFEGYFGRGEAKVYIEDYYGAIEDFKAFIKICKDSSFLTCYYMGISLYRTEKYTKSKEYLLIALKKNNEKDLQYITNIYLFLGYCEIKLNRKEQACLYWSKATEYGSTEAYDFIKEHCK